LALALGWPSVEWGLKHISSTELTEWMAYIELEGLPEINAEIRAAKALHAFINAHRDTEKRKSEYPFEEFLPEWLKGESQFSSDDEAQIDPRTAAAAAEKMAALQSHFR
jgi:hypothetical protein